MYLGWHAQGDPIALFEEAKLAKQKKGRELDWNFIFTNVEASAKKGYAIALYELGVFYFKGTPVLPYDHERSLAVLRMASEQARGRLFLLRVHIVCVCLCLYERRDK